MLLGWLNGAAYDRGRNGKSGFYGEGCIELYLDYWGLTKKYIVWMSIFIIENDIVNDVSKLLLDTNLIENMVYQTWSIRMLIKHVIKENHHVVGIVCTSQTLTFTSYENSFLRNDFCHKSSKKHFDMGQNQNGSRRS